MHENYCPFLMLGIYASGTADTTPASADALSLKDAVCQGKNCQFWIHKSIDKGHSNCCFVVISENILGVAQNVGRP